MSKPKNKNFLSSKLVTIGLIQNKVFKNRKKSLEKNALQIKKAAQKGAQIICLEELYRTVYFPQYLNIVKDDYCETIPGESTELFSKIAKEYQVIIIVPIFEKKNNKYYNSAVVIDANGKLMESYHKIHIPKDRYFYEKNYFHPGKNYKIYKTKYATFAVLICYDQWFPEAARIVSLKGAEIIFYPTAIGTIKNYKNKDGDWHNAWETVMRGNAIANAVHVAAINRVGQEDQLKFFGQSFVCDAFGKILKKASKTKDEILICKIDLDQNKRIKKGWGFIKNRRPETYGIITD